METNELRRRLALLDQERPGMLRLRDKDTGEALARCTHGAVMELLISMLDEHPEAVASGHWLWRYLRCAAPFPDAGPVFESLRRLAQGIDGKSINETAHDYLRDTETAIARRRGRLG